MEPITQDHIKVKITTDPVWAARAILALYRLQTTDEQYYQETKEHNDRGFNGVDAHILSSFAQQIQKGRTLSPKQLAIAYKKLGKYSGQLYRLSQNNSTTPQGA